MHAIWQYIKRIDKTLLFTAFICSAFSALLIYSMVVNGVSSQVVARDYKMQIAAAAVGIGCALVLAGIDYHKLCGLWFLYGPAALVMTLLLFTPLGLKREGVDDIAWLDLGFMSIQPSEFLKIAFIMTFAYHLFKVKDHINRLPVLALLCLHGAVPAGLVAVQGDYGTAIVFVAIFLTMLFTAGISWKYIVAALAVAPAALAFVWFYVLEDLHRDRFLVVFNPDINPTISNHQRLGKIALGSGQLYGKGLFGGEYSYVPEMKNDFVFSYIGQTLGFVGCLAVVCVLGFLCVKCITTSFSAREETGKYICAGAFGLFFSHSFMNIGMVLGVMPVIGIPLPFFTAGGTAMLSMWLAVGLVLSVRFHSKREYAMFYDKT